MKDLTKITVNGREYDSIEQMPPDIRQIYLQALDALREGKTVSERTIVNESITVNGRTYKSRDELPPEIRALLAQMPEPLPDGKSTDVKIKTVKTFHPQTSILEKFGDDGRAPEEDPVVAWLLVKILVVIVVILILLLGLKHIW